MSTAAPELADLPQSDVALERVLEAEGLPQVVRVHEHVRQGIGPHAVADGAAAHTVAKEGCLMLATPDDEMHG